MSEVELYKKIVKIASEVLIETFKDTNVKTSIGVFIQNIVIEADNNCVITVTEGMHYGSMGNMFLYASIKKGIEKGITHLYDRESIYTKSVESQRADFLMLAKDMKERLLQAP